MDIRSSTLSQSRSQYKKPVGAYIPPARRVKNEKFDDGSEDQQRFLWDENKKKITGLINRANACNLTVIVKELFKCNLIRYKGLFTSALIKAQEVSSAFTDVYAALLAIVNSRIRSIGVLVINRIILNYRQAFLNNSKAKCLVLARFVAHLINQEVVHEALGFQMIEHLINRPSPSSIEIAIVLLRECGAKLSMLNPTCLFDIFKILRDLSLESDFDTRTHEMIDMIHAIKKDKFRDFPPIKPSLDLVSDDEKVTHSILLTDPKREDYLVSSNYFKFDPKWSENEKKYEEFKASLLDDDEEYSESSEEDDNDEDGGIERVTDDKGAIEVKKEDSKEDVKPKIVDATGKDLTAFRRMVYLTIRSSVRHEEVVHKLLRSNIDPEFHDELCEMILDCCGQERTYESIYGLIASKFCQLYRREFGPKFEKLFEIFYATVHRFETNRIRNIAKFYANLLTTESIDWSCLNCLKLRETATSSAGRCFIKFLFTELVAILSLPVLIEYINDPMKEHAFKELFPMDEEQDIRFSINFFTCSGLGQLTENLRQELLSRQ